MDKDIHNVIKAKIEEIKEVLNKRGFSPPVIELARHIEFEHELVAISPVMLSISPEDVTESKCIFLTKSSDSKGRDFKPIVAKSLCYILLDPENTDIGSWDLIRDEIVTSLFTNEFEGLVVMLCPKLTGWNNAEGWHYDIMHLDKKGNVYEIDGLSLDDSLPWR